MNPYEILGIRENVSEKEIKKAYRDLVKMYHPEQGKYKQDNLSKEERTRKFIKIQMAYEEAIKRLEIYKSYDNSVESYDNQIKNYKFEDNQVDENLRKEMSAVLKSYKKFDNINLDKIVYAWFYEELKKINKKLTLYILNIKTARYYDYVIQSYTCGKDQIMRFYLKVEKIYCKQNEIPTELLEENPLNYDCSIEDFVNQLENLKKNILEEKNFKENEISTEIIAESLEGNSLNCDYSFIEGFVKNPFDYDGSIGDFVDQLEDFKKNSKKL